MNRMKIKVSLINKFLISLFFVLILSTYGVIKYLVMILVACLVLFKKKCLKKESLVISIPVLVIILVGWFDAITENNVSYYTLQETVFLITPLVISISLYSLYSKSELDEFIGCYFWAIVLFYVSSLVGRDLGEDLYESQYAYIFGCYVILFFYRKKYVSMMFSILTMCFANKRITTGAAIVCIGILLINDMMKKRRNGNDSDQKDTRNAKILLFLALGMSLLYIYVCKTNMISLFFSKYNINSMGRIDVWNMMNNTYSFDFLYTGKGLGYVKEQLSFLKIAAFALLHNDLLKVYIEIGFLPYVIWLCSFSVFVRKANAKDSLLVVALIISMLINFTTDNVLVYINFLFPFYLMILSMFSNNGE